MQSSQQNQPQQPDSFQQKQTSENNSAEDPLNTSKNLKRRRPSSCVDLANIKSKTLAEYAADQLKIKKPDEKVKKKVKAEKPESD